jgi:hypothetical protein
MAEEDNMKEDEKAQQIKRLSQELDKAKNNRNHLIGRIGTISSVYSEVGKILSYIRIDAATRLDVENGHLSIPRSIVNNIEISDNLLNEKQLIEVYEDYIGATELVSSLESQLAILQTER